MVTDYGKLLLRYYKGNSRKDFERWQNVKIAGKQLFLETGEVFPCILRIENSRQTFRKFRFMKMVRRFEKYFVQNALKVCQR